MRHACSEPQTLCQSPSQPGPSVLPCATLREQLDGAWTSWELMSVANFKKMPTRVSRMKVCISVLDISGFPTVLPIFGVAVDGW